MKKDYTQDILKKVNTVKAKPKWYFWLVNGLLIILILILFAFSIIFLAGLSSDTIDLLNFDLNFEGDLNFFSNFLFEFLILILIGWALIFAIYRQTDWFFVRQTKFLAGIIIFLIILSSGILAYSTGKENLEKITDTVEIFPNRQNRKNQLLTKLEERNIFVGEVVKKEKTENGFEYTLKNPLKTVTFISNRNYRLVRIGSKIVVRYEEKDGIKSVTKLRIIGNN